MDQFRLIMMGAATAILSIAISGCATTKVQKVTKSVPISYKYGDTSTKMASLTRPSLPSTMPAPYIPPAIRPAPLPVPSQGFDQASIDRDLYKHQKVGKRYTVMGQTYTPRHDPDYDEVGEASWYGPKFNGKPTATGETFDMYDLTAAHRTLPLNSMLYVTNMENGRTLMVRLNDRGPFAHGRIIDLSKASAEALGITTQGVAQVRVQYAGPADPMAAKHSIKPKAPQPAPYPQDNYVEAPIMQAPTPSPIPAPVTPYEAPQYAQPEMPVPIAPSRPQNLGQGDVPEGGGEVTLTIKGPIHVAKYEGTSDQARVIPAVHRREK